ncbi:MAG: hypothetical protein M1319_00120, partial [Chloroflexi bacterium]|nr:hypothetical protein [Chloroflexota bacterium]
MPASFRGMPSVDRLLQTPELKTWASKLRRDFVVEAIRSELSLARAAISSGQPAPDFEAIELRDRTA